MHAVALLARGSWFFVRALKSNHIATLIVVLGLIAQPGMMAAQDATPGATPAPIPEVGDTQFVAQFDGSSAQFTEGVTVDDDGTVYASISSLGQLARVNDDGTHEIVGQVEGLQEGDLGLLGLAAHADGSVFGAVFSSNADSNGVWRFDPEAGTAERVADTEQVTMPNAVAFGADDTMYITDTIAGAVWVVPQGGSAEPWLEHDMLAGSGAMGFGIPIGANGIAVDTDNGVVYVAVPEQGTIVAVPVMDDGSAGEPTVHAAFEGLGGADGIAIDDDGTLYSAQPAINTVSRISSDGDVEVVASGGNLDGPASVAVGPDTDVIYAANFSAALAGLIPPDGAGPGIVMISLNP